MDPIVLWIAVATILASLVMLSRFSRVNVRVSSDFSFHDLHATSMEAHQRIGEYLRANFSGDPAALATTLRGLLPAVREIAARHGQKLDDDLVRIVIASSITAHHLASRAQAEAAIAEALRLERGAA